MPRGERVLGTDANLKFYLLGINLYLLSYRNPNPKWLTLLISKTILNEANV